MPEPKKAGADEVRRRAARRAGVLDVAVLTPARPEPKSRRPETRGVT